MSTEQQNITSNVVLARFDKGQNLFTGIGRGADDLLKLIRQRCDKIENIVTVNPSEGHDYMTPMGTVWKEDFKNLYALLSSLPTYVLLGGDHTIGQPSVLASINKTENIDDLYVVWIDTHPDINSFASSTTKNYHGMPLAGCLGYEPAWFETNKTTHLPSSHLLYYGIRDCDKYETEQIAQNDIFHTSDSVTLRNQLAKIMILNPSAKFHVSFDVDALDSEYLDSTGCLFDKTRGLSPKDVIDVIKMIKSKMIAFDIAEYNPTIGDKTKSETTLKTIIDSVF
jgi:arginase